MCVYIYIYIYTADVELRDRLAVEKVREALPRGYVLCSIYCILCTIYYTLYTLYCIPYTMYCKIAYV